MLVVPVLTNGKFCNSSIKAKCNILLFFHIFSTSHPLSAMPSKWASDRSFRCFSWLWIVNENASTHVYVDTRFNHVKPSKEGHYEEKLTLFCVRSKFMYSYEMERASGGYIMRIVILDKLRQTLVLLVQTIMLIEINIKGR